MFAKVIRRMEILGPERERRCLEKFLLALTEIVRLLFIRNPDSSMRMQILIQANEINHRVLNRVMALQGGGDPFFTIEYTWHLVEEHVNAAPVMKDMVAGVLAKLLNDLGD